MTPMTRSMGIAAAVGVALLFGAGAGRARAEGAPAPAATDSSYTIKGGQERTDLKSLTVEGEDRVHVEIERPPLTLALDPSQVAGLVTGDAKDVLDRVPPDLTTSYYAATSADRSPYTGRPWLRQFSSGAVARFQPAVKGVERWKLTVADSRGQAVRVYEGTD